MMLMVRMVVMELMLVRMVVATEEKEDLKIKNPIDDCGDYTYCDEDTFSWWSPGRRSPRGGRWERGQSSTWTSFSIMLVVAGENVFSFISAFFAFFRVKFALFGSFLDKLPPFPPFLPIYRGIKY